MAKAGLGLLSHDLSHIQLLLFNYIITFIILLFLISSYLICINPSQDDDTRERAIKSRTHSVSLLLN